MALAFHTLAEQQQDAIAAANTLVDKLLKALSEAGVEFHSLDVVEAHAKLQEFSDDALGALDKRFREWGETWHDKHIAHYDLNDMVPAQIAADLLHISKGAISRLRATGKLKGEWRGARAGYYFKVRDVYAMNESPRWRRRGSIDSIPDNGESAPT